MWGLALILALPVSLRALGPVGTCEFAQCWVRVVMRGWLHRQEGNQKAFSHLITLHSSLGSGHFAQDTRRECSDGRSQDSSYFSQNGILYRTFPCRVSASILGRESILSLTFILGEKKG